MRQKGLEIRTQYVKKDQLIWYDEVEAWGNTDFNGGGCPSITCLLVTFLSFV